MTGYLSSTGPSRRGLLSCLLCLQLCAVVMAATVGDAKRGTSFAIIGTNDSLSTFDDFMDSAESMQSTPEVTPAPTDMFEDEDVEVEDVEVEDVEVEVATEMEATEQVEEMEEEENVPYNFTHVILIGGRCAPNDTDWPSKFVAPAFNTLPLTKQICSKGGVDSATTREFHLDGLRQVEEIAGDELNSTIVITIGQGLEKDWTPVANLLRRGMAFFHGGFTGDLVANGMTMYMNLTEYNLTSEQVLYFYFRLEEEASARKAGAEICRLKQGNKELRVGKIYRATRTDLTFRVDSAIKGFEEACPNTKLISEWELDFDWPEKIFRSTLMVKSVPEIVFSINDESLEKLFTVAKNHLAPDQYDRLSGSGWDATHPHLMQEQKLLATVDQMVFHERRGLWGLMDVLMQTMQTNGLRSTKAVQDELQLGDALYMTSNTLTVSADRVGYLLDQMLRGYNANSPPFQEVQASTGLLDLSITKFDPFDGYFDVVLWRKITWTDPRLSWNPFVYEGDVQIDATQIWTPKLFFTNEFSNTILHEKPITVTNDGRCVQETNMQVRFLCSTTNSLNAFPFDNYDCSIDLGSPSNVWMDASHGFHVVETDPHFETSKSISNSSGVMESGSSISTACGESDSEPPTERRRYLEQGQGSQQERCCEEIFFNLRLERKPFTAWVRLIIPAVLINWIGFMAFWIPEVPESVALGITSLLCSLAFRETVEMPDTADVSWTEVFMMVNIGYQASVMFIIWCSYGASQMAMNLNKVAQYVNPKTVVKKSVKKVAGKKKKDALGDVSEEGSEDDGEIYEGDEGDLEAGVEKAHKGDTNDNDNQEGNEGDGEIYEGDEVEQGAGVELAPKGDTNDKGNPSPEEKMEEEIRLESDAEILADTGELGFSAETQEITGTISTISQEKNSHVEEDITTIRQRKPDSAATGRTSTLFKLENAKMNDAPDRRGVEKYSSTWESKKMDHLHVPDRRRSVVPDDSDSSDDSDGMPDNSGLLSWVGLTRRRNTNARRMRDDSLHERFQEFGDAFKSSLEALIPDLNPEEPPNVDWIGRWVVVPSYIIIMASLLATGWGFYDD
ncbi:Neuronal acetylcholine receptor subunit alpha-4 [Seminavis robusta]|uniref:Neuronal acetylcholine receptor subunit alpha-4 n=1 Tax=Seminavis robusta TaxID=568900 RepID=A0A9N8DQF4_9STRA|nr:Neuronal acetylcholine receptor subunit alpha-4 [Seminavis robusta]|eukprot:Sro273_g105190.1 Neuronal acetylcholine receptor subunit alpha-4 (1072) ;mRNA; r:55858-59204